MVEQPPSSAETASQIQSHLTLLHKSRQRRLNRPNIDHSDLDRSDALTFDKLRRIFVRLVHDGSFNSSSSAKGNANSASAKWSKWLNCQLDQFINYLVEHIGDDKSYAVRTFCGVIASFPDVANGNEMVSERLLTRLLEAVFKCNKCLSGSLTAAKAADCKDLSTDETILDLLDGEVVRQFRDVQYYVFMVVQKLAVQLLEGLEKAKKEKVNTKKKETEQDVKDEAEQQVEIVAENMARLLLKMDYIAKSQEELMDGSAFMFAPPVSSEGATKGAKHDDDEEENGQKDEELDDSDASDSDSTDEEDNNDNNPGPSSDQINSFTKQTKKSKLTPWQQPYKHRNLLQEAWLSLLRLSIPPRTTKLILQHLSTYILTVAPTPLRFAEYFTNSFRNGTTTTNTNNSNSNSLTAILSLHGLFQLILNHQLEYPQFYPSLYKLLHPRILYTKHRTRFLRLLSKSLQSNTMLPAYVVAAFCKKLLRLGLAGPPSGALFVLALVSNLIRKHGEVGCLIHRRGEEVEDVFVEDAESLIETRALESSLWELTALQKHYHPAVASLAASCGTEDDRTPTYDMEDFMVHTYKSLFEQEKKRIAGEADGGGKKKKKTRVSLTFVEPKGLFCEGDVFGGAFKSF